MDYTEEVQKRIKECQSTLATKLDLSNLALTHIPHEVFSLTQLVELTLGGFDSSPNRIQKIPLTIIQLQNLKSLNLVNNRLVTLPEAVTKLQNLHILNLYNNQLDKLPDAIDNLQKLQRLHLGGNKLDRLPQSILKMQNLQILSIDDNQLYELPEVITKLRNLQVLNLSSNHINTLPESIANLKNLQVLFLNDNELRTLPEALMELQSLQRLDLSGNRLLTLPETFANMQNLRELYLDNNGFRTVPEVLTNLENLQELYLSENKLHKIPESIIKLQNLQELDIDDNPLQDPPLEIAMRGIKAIRIYFRERGEDYLYEAKLLLVGEGRVGKTSLAKSLCIADSQLEDEQSTEGVAIRQWIIPQTVLGLDKDFRFNLWDFGGQEIYHATHQFFLTRRSLYLLVTESRKEDKHDDFYYWLNIIRLLGDHSPVIIVLNKCDQPTKELPIHEYQRVFSNIVDFQKVSCQPGYRATIESLKSVIYRVLLDKALMTHIGTPLPKAWLLIREALEELRLKRNYISNDEYLALCHQYGLDENRSNVLSDYYHDIGVFLHFRDDLALSETIFLNYEWVTAAVYAVLDNATVKANYGHFTNNQLKLIWHSELYREKRSELLALMRNRKFELCYELPDGSYMAPQLLPVDEQPYKWRNNQDNLHFEYRYQFMPKGILSRFIVKRHQDIYQQTHWRYGVLLDWNNTRALVREHYFERKLTIMLEGENEKGFLEIIRKTIEEIHAAFNNLAVQEMIPCNCYECRKSQQHHFFRYELLERYRRAGKRQITCENSLQEVDVQVLINDVFLPDLWYENKLGRRSELHIYGDYHEHQITTSGGGVIIGGVTTGGDFIGRDQVT